MKMIKHRASWEVQKDFFAELVKRRTAQQESSSRFNEEALYIWCQAIGYGCTRNTEPYLEMIQDGIKADLRETEELNNGNETGEHTRYPEIPLLRLLDVEFPKVLESSTEDREQEHAESHELVKSLGDILKAYPTMGGVYHSALWSAVRFGFPYAAMYLANGSDVNATDPRSGSSPLHLIWCLEGKYTILLAQVLVLRFGAELEKPSVEASFSCPHNHLPMAGTPLAWSIVAGNVIAVQILLSLGADLMNGDGARCTPLEYAVALYQPDILEVVLEHLIDNGMLDHANQTVVGKRILDGLLPTLGHEQDRIKLHGSNIQAMATKTVDVIMEHWPGEKIQFLLTLLLYCVSDEDVPRPTIMAPYLVQVLFKAVLALAPAQNFPGWPRTLTLFVYRLIRSWETRGDNAVDVLDKLLQDFPQAIDLAAKDTLGRTALHHVVIHNATPFIPVLLRHGADIEAKDSSGHTPLGLAARMASADSFDLLIYLGAQIGSYTETSGHLTVLHLAAQLETQKSLVPYILFESKHRAMFNTPSMLEKVEGRTMGLTALAWSVICMHLEAIQALMTAGANCRAACWLPDWKVVLSVRELATIVRLNPAMQKLGATWQKTENVDPEEQKAWTRAVQEMFYSGCKESGYEEVGFVESEAYSNVRGEQELRLGPTARRTRPEESFAQRYVSIDVLDSWSPLYGQSKREENGLREDKEQVELLMRMPLTGGPTRTLLLIESGTSYVGMPLD